MVDGFFLANHVFHVASMPFSNPLFEGEAFQVLLEVQGTICKYR